MSAVASTSGRLHSEFVRLLFLQSHRETDRFFTASGVDLAHSTISFFSCQTGGVFLSVVEGLDDLFIFSQCNLDINVYMSVGVRCVAHIYLPSHSLSLSLFLSLSLYMTLCCYFLFILSRVIFSISSHCHSPPSVSILSLSLSQRFFW